MATPLIIRAGRAARTHIMEKGLVPEDILGVFGASGAAKWLAIYGLDRAIFSQWLNPISHDIYLFGTSIGAWKLAAGVQKDPGPAFDRLKQAYIGQKYEGRVTSEKITEESLKIFDQFLGKEKIGEILANPFLHLGFSAVQCKGPMALENKGVLLASMLAAFLMNLLSRNTQSLFFERTLFHVPGALDWPMDFTGLSLNMVGLSSQNFKQALLASGSIPVIMDGIKDIPGAKKGTYRDGGVLDYHPIFPLLKERQGFILYPHFYPEIIPGWFDKTLPNRRAQGDIMDRKDFNRFHGKDELRTRVWQEVAQKSLALGSEFLGAVETGRIGNMVQPF
ncbi:MAG: patatin-like phospholipase family protein [Desulfobacter sp.]|nr:patatin-like phospholipase family protein [Desulfobacter sp.]